MRTTTSTFDAIAAQDDDPCTVLFRDDKARHSTHTPEEALSRQSSQSSVLSDSDLDELSSSQCLDIFNMSLPSSLLGTPLCSTPLQPSKISASSASQSGKHHQKALARQELPRTLALLQEYLKTEISPRHGYLSSMQEGGISALDRAEVLLWLEELIQFHECDASVFVCAADLLDQLLTQTKLKPKHLRIAAVACFLIASKCLLEEADQPILADLVASVQEFSVNDLRRMELLVLDKLHWNVPSKSTLDVLHNLMAYATVEFQLDAARADEIGQSATRKFVACTVSYELLRFKPSEVATSILVFELSEATAFSEGFIRHIFQSELQIEALAVEACVPFVARHLRATAALFTEK